MRSKLHTLWRIISAPFRFIYWLFSNLIKYTVKGWRNFLLFFTLEEEDSSLPDAFAKSIQNPRALFEHINELRKHLFRAALYMVITTALSFLFIHQILAFLALPLEGGIASLQAVDVTEPVGTVMKVALLSGFALSFPFIAFELWWFMAPGLKRGERLFLLLAIPFSTLFFIAGMGFAYKFMLPVALPILLSFMGLSTIPRPNSYYPFVANLLFWLGMSFEFPLVIFALARLGMVKAQSLAKQWKIALVIISILAAAITTTTDPLNMALVMIPMTVLYTLSIGLAYIAERRRPKTT
jgi:sec-independent protein translocase protein TatC